MGHRDNERRTRTEVGPAGGKVVDAPDDRHGVVTRWVGMGYPPTDPVLGLDEPAEERHFRCGVGVEPVDRSAGAWEELTMSTRSAATYRSGFRSANATCGPSTSTSTSAPASAAPAAIAAAVCRVRRVDPVSTRSPRSACLARVRPTSVAKATGVGDGHVSAVRGDLAVVQRQQPLRHRLGRRHPLRHR